ncbi:coiled-coil domain-containing protein 7 [Trichosurus vulpecula]|uniref:coiled-coil domain-containing protein 7 n=1 Tax=Trichosurus vulpecula TaxID=9337 RepID=UPI00186AF259|nr:coiled-coil domain-containing protein 7 [Trichosurus vulpecula]
MENSELASKKASTVSAGLHKTRKKSSTKFINENELMFLAPPPVAESMLKHAIAIPSENSGDILDDEQVVRKVTKHLQEISSSLQKAYGIDNEAPTPEGEESTPTEAEDMTSFLVSCTALAKQLEEAVKEEQQILESLFKWFQQEVYHVEELVKEQNISDWELPLPDKAVSSSIAKVIEHLQKLEQLRNRLGTVPKVTRRAVAAKHKLDGPSETTQIYEDVKKMIEDFGTNFQNDEFVENIMEIADNVFLAASTESKDLQFQEMFKIFEKQAIKLRRVMHELDSLEFKYKLIQNDLDIITEERMILENELKKIKGPEKTEQLLQREKTLLELQRKKSEKNSSKDSNRDIERLSTDFSDRTSTISLSVPLEVQSASALLDVLPSKEQIQKGRRSEPFGQSFSKKSSMVLTSSDAAKLKEELLQAQKVVISLESENKFLQEQLKDALQEVEKAKKDLEVSHSEIRKGSRNDNESIASKKTKKGKKEKGESKKDKKAKTTKASQAANTKTAGRS